jgi:N-acylneuraminate cytidylyltransferase
METGCDYAISVTSFAYPIWRALKINNHNRLEMIQPEFASSRSQDLQESYHDAGQFYWGRGQAWLDQVPILGDRTVASIIPRQRVHDIDTIEDFECAEWVFRAMQLKQGNGGANGAAG